MAASAAIELNCVPQTTSILFQNSGSTIILIDLPQSISEGQQTTRKLFSSEPLKHPFPSVEPKSEKAKAKFQRPSLEQLVLQKHLEIALQELNDQYAGEFVYPRFIELTGDHKKENTKQKRKRTKSSSSQELGAYETTPIREHTIVLGDQIHKHEFTFHNHLPKTVTVDIVSFGKSYFPPFSTAILGNILTTSVMDAPLFNLIIMDPPWPNRSAKRSQSYSISSTAPEIRALLNGLNVEERLADDGLIAVWVTNKTVLKEMVVGDGGLFEQWGVDLVEEWVWLKVTSQGEPICALDSVWRKPWEVLLIGRKQKTPREEAGEDDKNDDESQNTRRDVKRRVIFGVPDVHSRKPCLKKMFEDIFSLGKVKREAKVDENGYKALEIFARYLTAGWWAWGDECLLFQGVNHWEKQISESVLPSLYFEETETVVSTTTPLEQ